jgi:hypothetical protein
MRLRKVLGMGFFVLEILNEKVLDERYYSLNWSANIYECK